jgi:hypothetical protein
MASTQAAVKAALKNALLGIPGPILPKGWTSSQTNGTAHVGAIPDVNPGDGLLAFAVFNLTTAVITDPAGWTTVGTQDVTGTTRSRLYKRVAQVGDSGAAVLITTDVTTRSVISVLAYAGTDGTDPVHAFAAATETLNQTTHTTPNVVTAKGGCLITSLWAQESANNLKWSSPTNEIARARVYGPNTGGAVDTLVTDRGAVEFQAGTFGSKTATAQVSTANALMWTVALNPASPTLSGIQVLYGEADERRREAIWMGNIQLGVSEEPRALRPGAREEDYTLLVHCENGTKSTPEATEARAIELANLVTAVVDANPNLGVPNVSWVVPAGTELRTTESEDMPVSVATVSLQVKARL